MKPFRFLTLAFVALVASACNDGDVTKGSTVPPIAGIVGGPSAGGGAGEVGMEIEADEGSVVLPGEIVVKNLSREVADVVTPVPGENGEFVFVKIQADVGDELEVSLEHPEEGHVTRVFEVGSPEIEEVRDPEGPQTVIHAGLAAQISGSGFCSTLDCNAVLFDSTHVATNAEPRPGLLYFTVPAGAALGEHTVRVATAGTEGGDEDYLSDSFTVSVTAN